MQSRNHGTMDKCLSLILYKYMQDWGIGLGPFTIWCYDKDKIGDSIWDR